jgi:hypothetical protein
VDLVIVVLILFLPVTGVDVIRDVPFGLNGNFPCFLFNVALLLILLLLVVVLFLLFFLLSGDVLGTYTITISIKTVCD